MLRLTIAAWAALLVLPAVGLSQEDKSAAERAAPAIKAPADKPAPADKAAPVPGDKPAPVQNPAVAPAEVLPHPNGVVVPEAKILIRPWNYDSEREWDYTLSNGRSAHAPVGTTIGPNGQPVNCGPRIAYEDAYNSIPFRRSQYNANPSYRHDSAMEVMFGVLRPTTTVKNTTQPVAPEYPYPFHNDFRRHYGGGYPMLNPYYVYPHYSQYAY